MDLSMLRKSFLTFACALHYDSLHVCKKNGV